MMTYNKYVDTLIKKFKWYDIISLDTTILNSDHEMKSIYEAPGNRSMWNDIIYLS